MKKLIKESTYKRVVGDLPITEDEYDMLVSFLDPDEKVRDLPFEEQTKLLNNFRKIEHQLAIFGKDVFDKLKERISSLPSKVINRKASIMETVLAAKTKTPIQTLMERNYEDNLIEFFTKVLIPAVCRKERWVQPTIVFKDYDANQADDEHNESLYAYCVPKQETPPDFTKGTHIVVQKYILSSPIFAEALLLHELAHHAEWTVSHVWYDNKIFHEGEWVPLDTRGRKRLPAEHTYVWAAYCKILGIVPTVFNSHTPDETMFTKPQEFMSYQGKPISRTEFYAKKN